MSGSCSKWENYFSRVYHSDVSWKWVNMGTPVQNLHYHENTLRNIWEQLRLLKPPPQNPINSHHKWNQPMTHLSHLGKNQCCTSWYIGWNLGIYNVGIIIGIEEQTSWVWPEPLPALYQYPTGMGLEVIPGIYLPYISANTRFIPAIYKAQMFVLLFPKCVSPCRMQRL